MNTKMHACIWESLRCEAEIVLNRKAADSQKWSSKQRKFKKWIFAATTNIVSKNFFGDCPLWHSFGEFITMLQAGNTPWRPSSFGLLTLVLFLWFLLWASALGMCCLCLDLLGQVWTILKFEFCTWDFWNCALTLCTCYLSTNSTDMRLNWNNAPSDCAILPSMTTGLIIEFSSELGGHWLWCSW